MNAFHLRPSVQRQPLPTQFLRLGLLTLIVFLAVIGSANRALGGGIDNEFGGGAGNVTLTGSYNTGFGYGALFPLTTGNYNTAYGYVALYSNTTGVENTATGAHALYANTTGGDNTANGYQALLSNTTGSGNTANGAQALQANTIGNYNTANSAAALYSNTTGNNNTANGYGALQSNTTGDDNVANGFQALWANATGYNNVANGFHDGGNLDFLRATGGAGDAAGTEPDGTAMGGFVLEADLDQADDLVGHEVHFVGDGATGGTLAALVAFFDLTGDAAIDVLAEPRGFGRADFFDDHIRTPHPARRDETRRGTHTFHLNRIRRVNPRR